MAEKSDKITDQKFQLEVLEQLTKLNDRYESLEKQMDLNYDRLDEKLGILSHIIVGNGDPSKGLVVRFDRIEQSNERREWLNKTAVAAAIAAVLLSIAGMFIKPNSSAAETRSPTTQILNK